MLMGFLKESAGEIVFIGIEPEDTGYGEGLSSSVEIAMHQLLRILVENRFENIPLF